MPSRGRFIRAAATIAFGTGVALFGQSPAQSQTAPEADALLAEPTPILAPSAPLAPSEPSPRSVPPPAPLPPPLPLPALRLSANPTDAWPAPPPDDRFVINRRLGRAVLQTTGGLVAGLVWYWRGLEFNSQDWDLRWDAPSWRKKLLTTDALRFDTNDFVTNGQDHSRAGVAYYLVGRANGFDIKQSWAMDAAATLIWEYIIEFRELISINDLIINSMSGPAVGEPLLQVGRFFRRGRPTLINQTLAFVFSPFEWLTGWLDNRPWPGDDQTDDLGFSVERGHQFKAFVNGRAVNFGPGTGRTDATLGIDMEVMMQHEYGRPGRWAGWIRAAEFSRMATTFTFGEGMRWLGTTFRTQTTLVGHYRQHIGPDGAVGRSRYGYGFLLGGGSGFDYQTRTLAAENDRLAVVNLFGPQLDLTLYRGGVFFRFEIAGYGDFAMVDSHALGPETPASPTQPLTGVLRAQGYYYGYGATGIARARLDLSWWTLSAEVRAHHFASFDGLSRVEDSPLDAGLKDLTDDRVFASAWLALRPWNRNLGFAAFVEAVGRQGTLGPASRSSREISSGVEALIAY